MTEDGDQADEDHAAGSEDPTSAGQVVVPWQRLSEGALRGVIEEFVTREGTEYGASDVALEAKVKAVRRQLERGEIVVLFDGATSSVNLATREALREAAVPPAVE